MITVAAVVTGALLGPAIVMLALRLTPKYPKGTPVRWRYAESTDNEWNTGVYVRHAAIGYHLVKVTGPLWWSAALGGRGVVVRARELEPVTR